MFPKVALKFYVTKYSHLLEEAKLTYFKICVPGKVLAVEATKVTDGNAEFRLVKAHTPYFSKMGIGPSAYASSKKTHAANRKERSKKRTSSCIITSKAASSFSWKKWDHLKVSLYCFTHFEIYLPLHATRV